MFGTLSQRQSKQFFFSVGFGPRVGLSVARGLPNMGGVPVDGGPCNWGVKFRPGVIEGQYSLGGDTRNTETSPGGALVRRGVSSDRIR